MYGFRLTDLWNENTTWWKHDEKRYPASVVTDLGAIRRMKQKVDSNDKTITDLKMQLSISIGEIVRVA